MAPRSLSGLGILCRLDSIGMPNVSFIITEQPDSFGSFETFRPRWLDVAPQTALRDAGRQKPCVHSCNRAAQILIRYAVLFKVLPSCLPKRCFKNKIMSAGK